MEGRRRRRRRRGVGGATALPPAGRERCGREMRVEMREEEGNKEVLTKGQQKS